MTDRNEKLADTEGDDELEETYAAAADVEFMFAQTSANASVADGRLILEGVSPMTLFFSDRPHRLTGHLSTDEFIADWGEGDDSFASNPPNALVSLLEEEYVNDVVVILTDPQLSNGNLSYAVEVTDGEFADSDGPCSLFIDMIGRPLTPLSVAGARRRGWRRGRRRARRRMRRR